jgi:SanA protein
VLSFSENKVFSNVDKIENQKIWLVLWASVVGRKWPSDILKDRLIVANEAYKKWKITKIIVSWDNSKESYNEPIVMRDFLVKNWVKKDDIYMDFAWFDTYDSIYRAKNIFLVKKMVIFTQDFHIKRALYIADRLWIDSVWIDTDLHKYVGENYNLFREFFARIKAFINTDILNSKPKFLWDEIIIE